MNKDYEEALAEEEEALAEEEEAVVEEEEAVVEEEALAEEEAVVELTIKERTEEEKAEMYSAMLGSVSVITSALDGDNDFCSEMTVEEVKERVMRSSGYLSSGVALDDWGSEDMSTINAAITAAEAA